MASGPNEEAPGGQINPSRVPETIPGQDNGGWELSALGVYSLKLNRPGTRSAPEMAPQTTRESHAKQTHHDHDHRQQH